MLHLRVRASIVKVRIPSSRVILQIATLESSTFKVLFSERIDKNALWPTKKHTKIDIN